MIAVSEKILIIVSPFPRRARGTSNPTQHRPHRRRQRALNVLQSRGSPDCRPVRNQRARCSAEPCVNESGPAAGPFASDLVVADGRGRAQAALDVLGVDDVALLRIEAPDARVTIGLQLEAHRQRVTRPLVGALRLRVELAHRAEQVLHVVPDLVRDHVRLREVARRAEARCAAR